MFDPEILLTLKLDQRLFTDPRRIALLKAIEDTGSLSQAAKKIGISYKTAWDSINEINQLAVKPFVISSAGGKGGGGAKLSAYAVRFIQLYDLLTKMQSRAFNILKDDDAPFDDILATTAKLSLQSSARNQLSGYIKSIEVNHVAGFITVLLDDNTTEIKVYITHSSIKRLQLAENKAVILLIKAPQIEIEALGSNDNDYYVKINRLTQDNYWCELELLLPSGIMIYATKSITEVQHLALKEGQNRYIHISPENIIIATLI